MDSKKMTLRGLATKHNADKKIHVGLLEQYQKYLPKKCKKFLEIGCLYGNSARMFKEWYGNETEFHLLDLFGEGFLEESKMIEEGFLTYKGSQVDFGVLAKLPKDINVISEDCSHHSDEQIVTFKYLFANHLESKGLYVIEDCYGHFDEYWRRGIIQKPEDTIVGVMQKFMNKEDLTSQLFTPEESDYFKKNIKEVKLEDNITLFIWKK